MNRVLFSAAAMTSSGIALQIGVGTEYTYFANGQRASATTEQQDSGPPDTDAGQSGTQYWTDSHEEFYSYTASGYLSTISVTDEVDDVGDTLTYLAAVYGRDAMGDATSLEEYNTSGSGVNAEAYEQAAITTTYDADSQEATETNVTYNVNETTYQTNATTFDYYNASGVYDDGQVGSQTDTITGTGAATVTTANTYAWNTSLYETGITVTSTASGSVPATTALTYDGNGDIASAAVENNNTTQTVSYITNASGEVMSRTESTGPSQPFTSKYFYYYLNGVQVGEIDNDGQADNANFATDVNRASQYYQGDRFRLTA